MLHDLFKLCNLLVICLLGIMPVFADTVYLKNGRSIDGFVKSEQEDIIQLDIGCGTVGFLKSEVERIYRSTPEESESLLRKWELQKQQRQTQEQEKQKEKQLSDSVPVRQDNGHMFVNAVLNEKIKATLLIDTGASVVILSKELAQKLNFAPAKQQKTAQLQMADGRKIEANIFRLESVRLQGIEEKNVEAAVLPAEFSGSLLHDGLLGMSFLNRFNFSFDYKNNRLFLKK